MSRFAFAFAFAFAVLGSATAADPEKDRRAWEYTDGGKTGRIVNESGQHWIETTTGGGSVPFEEVDRTDQYVEIRDAGRKLRLRLFAEYGEFRQEPQPKWNRWVNGKWIAPPKREPPEYRVRVAYFVPKDRQPTANFEAKIRVVMHYVRDLYRTDLRASGYTSDGPRFALDGDQPRVQLVRGKRDASYYNGAPKYDANQQWSRLLPELTEAVGTPNRHLIIAFAETYDDGPAPFEWPGGIALGARFSTDGGLGIFSAWILRDELCATTVEQQKKWLFDTTPIKGRTALGHGRPNSPRFEYIEDGFGAVAHEMGHALGLPHDHRKDDRDVMGNGFRNLRLNYGEKPPGKDRVGFSEEAARILMSSRFLATDLDPSDATPPKIELKLAEPPRVGATKVKVTMTATDDRGLRAVLFWCKADDSTVGGQALSKREHSVEVELPVRKIRPGPVEIEAFVTDSGGHLTRATASGEAKK